MFKKISLIAVIIIGLVLAAALASRKQETVLPVTQEKLAVVASFYPLAYLAEEVGGERVTVRSVIPMGTEPHDFEPTPQDIIALRSSRVFVYNGNGLDPWADRLRSELESAGLSVVAASQAVSVLPVREEAVEIIMDPASTEDHEEQYGYDPHIWLDPIRARQISELIRDALIAADPAGAAYYRAQATTLQNRLSSLHQDYEKTLSACINRSVVVSHDAFNYLASRYKLSLYPIAGLSPDAEPSTKRLADLTTLIKEQKVSTIFFESLASSRLAETLAKETGARTAVLNPIEGLTVDDLAAGKNYESLMRDNLSALSTALVCK